MMTAKPQCCPQCSDVEYYTTLFPRTLYRACRDQTLVQSQQFVVAQIGLCLDQLKQFSIKKKYKR